jgi:hypothetical protein
MKPIIALIFLMLAGSVWAYGIGSSSLPMPADKKIVSTEASGIVTKGGGVGLQVRYNQKLNQNMLFDVGAGVSGGNFANRIFTGLDYELYPDYENQPRISVKGSYENAKEFTLRKNVFTVSPTVSKGASFWGREGFPYIALPLALELQSKTKTYQTTVQLNAGINAPLPIQGFEKLIGHAEGFLSVRNSFSGMLVGVSYPIN